MTHQAGPTGGRLDRTDEDWWRHAVVYQIYPRSFADGNGDGVGDLPGVRTRLDHLSSLGIDAVWFSPFYPSPLADGGYDITDYRNVDPRLGTLSDFERLVGELHERGMRAIVDIVPNHTSQEHPWFQEALASPPGSRARERYIFRDGLGPGGLEPPSDWRSHFGGSAWERIGDGQWYLHLFAKEQPDLNWDNPEVREDFETTLHFWADLGVDGFRVDVAHSLAKDLSHPLRSQPHLDSQLPLTGDDPLYDRDAVHEIYRGWRKVFNQYAPPRMAVAETWMPTNPRTYLYARPDELGQVFDFSLLKSEWYLPQFRSVIQRSLDSQLSVGGGLTWVLSSHDVPRHASRYAVPVGTDLDAWLLTDGHHPEADLEAGLRRARAATLMMLALPGSAYLYQGEELGLPEVADLRSDQLQDPVYERTGHQLKGRDGCRVPLPWTTDGPAFGFSEVAPWLPQPAGFADHAVESLDNEPGSILNLYRRAIALRRELDPLDPEITWPDAPEDALSFTRSNGWACLVNFGHQPLELPPGEVVLTSRPLDGGLLPPETTAWLRLER